MGFYTGLGLRAGHLLNQLARTANIDHAHAPHIMLRPRLLDVGDWVGAGRILAKIGAKYGFDHIGRSRLTNDTLIAVSAARLGIQVLTANAKDYARIAEFRQFDWKILQQ